jgi:hypothetical protein
MNRASHNPWAYEKIPAVSTLQQKSAAFRQTPACAFRAKQTAHGNHVSDRCVREFRLPEGNLLDVGYRVSSLHCTKFSIAMVLVSGADDSQRAIMLIDVKTTQVYFQQ